MLSKIEGRILADLRDPTGLALVNTALPIGYDSAGGSLAADTDAPYLGVRADPDTAATAHLGGEKPDGELPVDVAFAARAS